MSTDQIKVLVLQPECHDRSHDRTDLVEQLIAAFPEGRYEVTSAFLRGMPNSSHQKSGADKVHYFNLPTSVMRGWRLRLGFILYRYCRDNRFDVVICNRYKPTSLLMLLNRLLKIPVCVGIVHGLGEYDKRWRRVLARAMITDSWHFVGVSDAVRNYLVHLGCGFTNENTIAIDNAIDVKETESLLFSREDARRMLGFQQHGIVLGSIGRLAKVKGHIYLLRAFAQVASKFPDANLVVIGDGREEAQLHSEITSLGLEGRVFLPGFRAQAGRYVRAFDYWVMPSLSEGLPRALLEGLSGRLPVVASNIAALRTIVEGAGGLTVPPADDAALAQALEQTLSMTECERKARGEQAYQYLCEHHDVSAYKKAYFRLVESALETIT